MGNVWCQWKSDHKKLDEEDNLVKLNLLQTEQMYRDNMVAALKDLN
jgi:hypothetical protein